MEFSEQDVIAVFVRFGPQKIIEIVERLKIKKAIEMIPGKKQQFLDIVKKISEPISPGSKHLRLKPQYHPKS